MVKVTGRLGVFGTRRNSRAWLAMVALSMVALCIPAATSAQDESAVPAFKQLDSMEARVQGCVTCHGQSGQGTGTDAFPRIAGKPAGYLYNQLVAFRDGTRRYTPMNYLVAYLPDPYLREMANYFAALRPPFTRSESRNVDSALLTRGASLVAGGDPAKGIPACVACHGNGLTGMNPGIPGLVGLSAPYIAGQLTRWRVGERHAVEPDCMRRVATRLTEGDIAAVAAWLSQQDPPKDSSPESSNLVRMPWACGSQR